MEGRYTYMGPSLTYESGVRLERGEDYFLSTFIIDDHNIWYRVCTNLNGQQYQIQKKADSLSTFKHTWIPNR